MAVYMYEEQPKKISGFLGHPVTRAINFKILLILLYSRSPTIAISPICNDFMLLDTVPFFRKLNSTPFWVLANFCTSKIDRNRNMYRLKKDRSVIKSTGPILTINFWYSLTLYDYDYVWLCMTMYDYVWLCMTMYDYIWLYLTM